MDKWKANDESFPLRYSFCVLGEMCIQNYFLCRNPTVVSALLYFVNFAHHISNHNIFYFFGLEETTLYEIFIRALFPTRVISAVY